MVEQPDVDQKLVAREHLREFTKLAWPGDWPENLTPEEAEYYAGIVVNLCTIGREVASTLRARLTVHSTLEGAHRDSEGLNVLAGCESALAEALTRSVQFRNSLT
ncbi:hypothetical protein Acsp05_45410 [Actinokineospora sp. NBRC 105648]|nr:hypothetical protein Acsp05_45410 [Actinokineospora sp. NBRC 105648]